MNGPLAYDPEVDAFSQRILDAARRLVRSEPSVPARQERIRQLAEQLERRLRALHDRRAISRDQLDGGPNRIAACGGELHEIRVATSLALELVAAPRAARSLGRCPLLYTTDTFHNVTLTGAGGAGETVHLRFGTHGGLELRRRAPHAEGFPYPGSKWVEGDLILGERVYGFVSHYTDALKVRLDDETGAPVALEFVGHVDAKGRQVTILPSGPAKWRASRPATQPTGRARLELAIPLRATGGTTRRYGALGMAFVDRNFALASAGGSISLSGPDGSGRRTVALEQAFGQLEEGRFENLPRAIPIAYAFVQGQRIDSAKALARARAIELLPLFPEGSALRGELEALGAGPLPAVLAARLDADLRLRARTDLQLRRRAAPLLVAHLARAALPESADRTTSTQFRARLLAEGRAARVVGEVLGAALREAGQLDAAGVFHRHSARHGLRPREDLVDPLAILNVNEVPLYLAKRRGRFARARLERRSELLFDAGAGAFLLGFQEVFHDQPRS